MKLPRIFSGWGLLISAVLLVALISATGSFGMGLAVVLLACAGVTLLYSIVVQLKDAIIKPEHRLYTKDFSLKFLATVMGFFLVTGAALYMYVFYIIHSDSLSKVNVDHEVQFSNVEYLLRAFISSLDLFMLDVDSNILDRLDSQTLLKGCISVQAVLSFACTVAMLASLVYSRINAYYKLNYLTKINDKRNHLYLFFGDNQPSELLIKDILKHDPKALTIIIDEANVKEEDNDEWNGIVGLVVHNHKIFKTAEKMGVHVAIAGQQLKDVDAEIANRPDFDAFGYLGLGNIKKFIQKLLKTASPELHIFFMSENEEDNISNILTLAKDRTIISVAKEGKLSPKIYCHARYNGPHRVLEDIALKKNLTIKIVDSSHIAVEMLKLDPESHPINVVRTSTDNLGTVCTAFKSLIIGFGEVGSDAFRFLYEFGAFPDSSDPNRRSPFSCTIVDNNLDEIKGSLISGMPAIFHYDQDRREFVTESITFKNIDLGSEEFYSSVLLKEDFLKEVNYIVISISSNEEAIALAGKIFTLIRRCREDVSDLRIFVRCTDDSKAERIQKIADHYNFGYGKGEENVPVIRIFGQPAITYTYDLVVSDSLIEAGKVFHAKYQQFASENESWDARHKKLTLTPTPDIDKLRKLRRQESQDRANALHAATKIIILERAMQALAVKEGTTVDWATFLLRYFNPDGSANVTGVRDCIRYPGLSIPENEIILHLAMLEHLRWNAAHELMGYVFNDKSDCCDERSMRHNCLCPWSLLDEQSEKVTGWPCDYKKYDFCVVDTTISLHKSDLLTQKTENI